MKTSWKKIIYRIVQWGFLAAFVCACILILVESATPGTESASQSTAIATIINERIEENHDKKTIKEIEDFSFEYDNSKTLYPGDTLDYTIGYTPEDTTYKNVTFSLSNESIMKVDSVNSSLSFLEPGECDLTITSEHKTQLSKTYHFTVNRIAVTGISVSVSSLSLNINDIYALNAEALPSNATEKGLTYSSSNDAVASVSTSGIITAKAKGSCTITIVSLDNSSIYKSIQVTVKEKEFQQIDVTSISFKSSSQSTYPSKMMNIYLIYEADNSTFIKSNLNVTSSDTKCKVSSTSFSGNNKIKIQVYYSDKTISSKVDVTLSASYKVNESKTLTANTTLTINPLLKLTSNDINTSKIQSSYSGNIYSNTYYNSANTYDTIAIKIPYISSVTSATSNYNLTNYSVSASSSLSITSKSYNTIKAKPSDASKACEGTVTFFVDKSDSSSSIVFHVSYTVKTDTSHITDIEMTRLYEENESDKNRLFLNEKYEDLFSYSIQSSGNSSSFASSGIKCTFLSGEDLVDPIYTSSVLTGIKTKDTSGTVRIKISSAYEENISTITNPVSTIVSIEIGDYFNEYSVIYANESSSDSYKIKKGEKETLDILLTGSTSLKDKSYTKTFYDSYTIVNPDDGILLYDASTGTVEGIKKGKTTLRCIPTIASDTITEIEIPFEVEYEAPQASLFTLDLQITDYPEDNMPSDTSTVAIGTKLLAKGSINEDATYKGGSYSSTNETILKVDSETGEIEALEKGEAYIRFTSEDDPTQYKEKKITVVDTTCDFEFDFSKTTLLDNTSKTDSKTGIKYSSIRVEYGKSYILGFTLLNKATSTDFTFENIDWNGNKTPSCAMIDSSGNLMTKSTGSTIVRVTYGNQESSLKSYQKYLEIRVDRNLKYTLKQLANKLRKVIGHFLLFMGTAIIGIVFVLMTFKGKLSRIISLLCVGVIGFALAGISELIQKYTPGRYCAWADVGIDSSGYESVVLATLIVVLIVYLVLWLRKKRQNKKTDSDCQK